MLTNPDLDSAFNNWLNQISLIVVKRISLDFLELFFRPHFMGKLVMRSGNVGCFLRLTFTATYMYMNFSVVANFVIPGNFYFPLFQLH